MLGKKVSIDTALDATFAVVWIVFAVSKALNGEFEEAVMRLLISMLHLRLIVEKHDPPTF